MDLAAVSSGDTGPAWWVVPVVAGVFLIFGALIALVSTQLSDRRRARAEDIRQWDRDIREFALMSSEQFRIITDAWNRRNRDMKGAKQSAAEAYESIKSFSAAVRLVSGKDLQDAYHRFSLAVQFLSGFIDDPTSKQELYQRVYHAHLDLISTTRRALRVPYE